MRQALGASCVRACSQLTGRFNARVPRHVRSAAYAAYNEAALPTDAPPSGSFLGAGYEVYKGRAAVQFKPIYPSFVQGQSGPILKRKGVILMEFANSIGQRQYDWGNKVTFAISPTEMAQVFLTNMVAQGAQVDLFHDPSMGQQSQGQVKKTLKAYLMEDKVTVGLTATESQGGDLRTVSVQLSVAEFLVVQEMCRFFIPRALGMA